MVQWEYQITFHHIPQASCEEGNVIECDQTGECFVHDTCRAGGMEWLESHLRKRGKEGWELVQSAYHQREILCIWKKKIEI
jgi:hypothetical protein